MDPKDFQNTSAGKVILTQAGYWAFIPNPLPPKLNWSDALVSALSRAERELSRLNTLSDAFPFNRSLIVPFIRQEAVFSSRIEGTRASLVELYVYESGQLTFLEPDDDTREVINYVRALEYGLDRVKTLPISLRLIREMHAHLMKGVRGELLTPGEFRRSQNWIGASGSTLKTAIFVPPPIDEMLITLDALEKFLHTTSQIAPLVRAGMLHYQFEVIHPFLDGNGRIGRLLIILLLNEWKLLKQPFLNLSVFFETHRQEYYGHLLDVSRKSAWEKWLTFFFDGISSQAIRDTGRIEHLVELKAHYLERIQPSGRYTHLVAVLNMVFQRPILSIRQVEASLGIPYMSAERCIEKLVIVGILRMVSREKRNRLYRADEVLAILES
ncbi:MAG: Fic family protein [Anaerolineaceae bacterium]|nr:Fic family protein [Anaerolineaceae bacterium]MBN2677952.1 Fic family protein [Anaerolineaceae bacterium]